MDRADAVFTGEVIRLKTVPGFGGQAALPMSMGGEVTMRVTKTIKGRLRRQVTVFTGIGGGDCGYHFQEAQSYLIYAHREARGRLATRICTRTQPLTAAGRDEVLELEGRLPRPKTPAAEPILELKGTTNDGGYHGYIFVLWNRLHERIYYTGSLDFAEVNRAGRWEAYPGNSGFSPRWELSRRGADRLLVQQAGVLARRDEAYRSLGPGVGYAYVNRLEGNSMFVAKPTSRLSWRVGLKYLTESESDGGKRIQDSTHFVWSQPIDGTMKLRNISQKEELGLRRLSYPKGTRSPLYDVEVK